MAKFTFKDTGKEIKVGDVFYYIGYADRYSKGTRSITKIVKSCTVQTISNFYINRNIENDEHQFLITDDINSPTFVINDCLYSSQEACNDAIEISKKQKSISQDIFAIHDINIIKEIHNKIFNNINL